MAWQAPPESKLRKGEDKDTQYDGDAHSHAACFTLQLLGNKDGNALSWWNFEGAHVSGGAMVVVVSFYLTSWGALPDTSAMEAKPATYSVSLFSVRTPLTRSLRRADSKVPALAS